MNINSCSGNNHLTDSRRGLLACLLLSACILLIYWNVQYQGFIHFDDTSYVVENRHVQRGMSGAGFLWAMGSTEAANWHPLTWLSLMLDYE
ncbi:MAG: hypothetical protein HY742_01050, partial [Deltaproteobacteria bacterium]|nr:hypothetical protein [Deltaproteobacteria bacterium]